MIQLQSRESFEQAWRWAEPLLKKALEYDGGRHDLESVKRAILEDRAKLWLGVKSAAVTELVEYPGKKVFRVWLAAGDMEELTEELLPFAIDLAERVADAIEIQGRPGWAKVLKEHGFEHRYTVMERDLR